MAVTKELSRFTRDALIAGKSRAEIAQVLQSSGWSAAEVAEASLPCRCRNPKAPFPRGTFSPMR